MIRAVCEKTTRIAQNNEDPGRVARPTCAVSRPLLPAYHFSLQEPGYTLLITVILQGNNFSDFLFTVLHTKSLLNGGLLSKGNKFFSFRVDSFSERGRKPILTKLHPLTLCMLGNFVVCGVFFFFFFSINCFKKSFRNTIRVSNS